MAESTWHHQWSMIDASSDPSWFIRFLDASRRRLLDAARRNPSSIFPWAKPGMSVLDVGCGIGELLHPLSRLLGESGRIVGVDLSAAMIAEAQRRLPQTARRAPIELKVANATALPFDDRSFDIVTANLLLQHLPDPAPALAEMARLLRPGGSLLIVEQDWDSLLISHSDRALTRRIIHNFCDSVPNGWVGRQLPAKLASTGLENVSLIGNYQVFSPEEWLDPAMGLCQMSARARLSGAISAEEESRWNSEIDQRIRDNTFHSGFNMFRCTGMRPAD